MKRRLTAAGLVVAAYAAAGVSLAYADPTPAPIYQQAASGVLAHPVYVAPGANAQISQSEVQKLDDQIAKAGVPVYIAILPERDALAGAENSVDKEPAALGSAVGRTGAYAVIAGHNFRANANGALPSGETADIANKAFQNNNPGQNRGRIYPMLSDFVKNVGYAVHPETKPKSHVGKILLIVALSLVGLGLLIFLGFLFAAWRHNVAELRREREREAAAAAQKRERFEQRKRDTQASYARVQDLVLNLTPGDNAQAKRCYEEALSASSRSQALIDQAITTADLDAARAEATAAEASARDCQAFADGRDPVQERASALAEQQRREAEAEAERQRQWEADAPLRLAAAEKRATERAAAAAAKAERKRLAKTVKPTKYQPVAAATETHAHYYGGGYYQNSYYGPGYYSDPFWNWVVMEQIADRGYGSGSSSSSSSDRWSGGSSSSSSSWGGSDSSSGGGSWGGDSGGGGSFDSGSGGGSW